MKKSNKRTIAALTILSLAVILIILLLPKAKEPFYPETSDSNAVQKELTEYIQEDKDKTGEIKILKDTAEETSKAEAVKQSFELLREEEIEALIMGLTNTDILETVPGNSSEAGDDIRTDNSSTISESPITETVKPSPAAVTVTPSANETEVIAPSPEVSDEQKEQEGENVIPSPTPSAAPEPTPSLVPVQTEDPCLSEEQGNNDITKDENGVIHFPVIPI